jgi:hypothetical protein
VALIRRDVSWRSRLGSVVAAVVPIGMLVVPWCVLFYLRCGVFVPSWVKPDAWLIEHNSFVSEFVNRPWYYYALKLPLVMPLLVVVAWAYARDKLVWLDWRVRVAAAWFAVILVAMTMMSVGGYGFQMRQVAPAVPAVYVLVICLVAQRDRPIFLMASAFTILLGTVTGALFLSLPKFDEIMSLAEIARLIEF